MTARILFKSDLLTIAEHNGCSCQQGRHEGGISSRKVTLVRRGVYTCLGGGEHLVVDGLTAAVYDGRSDYRIDYPTEDIPHTTYLDPGPALMDEAFPTDRFHTLVGPVTAMKHHRLHARANAAAADPAAIEEAALELLADLSESIGERPVCPGPAGLAVRRRLDNVREKLMAEPEINHPLAELAREAGCSPFHFARLFRRETGCSVRAWRTRLRLGLVMHRLAQGAEDLTGVALDAGFSHHSHMSTAFRTLLGTTPSELRREWAMGVS